MVVDTHTHVVTSVITQVVTPILCRIVPSAALAKAPNLFFYDEVLPFMGSKLIH
jgi:hypothetical protein